MLVTLQALIVAIRAGDYWEIIKDIGALLMQIAALRPPVSEPHVMQASFDGFASQNIDSLADELQLHVDGAEAGRVIDWGTLVPLLKAILTIAIGLVGN